MDKVEYYRGKRVIDMSKSELVIALSELAIMNRKLIDEHIKQLENLTEIIQ